MMKIDLVKLAPRALLRVRKEILAWIEVDVAILDFGYTKSSFETVVIRRISLAGQRGDICIMVA
jgi:hypothetical protein